MASRCGYLRLPLRVPSGGRWPAAASTVRPAGDLSGHGSGGFSTRDAGRTSTAGTTSRVPAQATKAYLAVEEAQTTTRGSDAGGAQLASVAVNAAAVVWTGVSKAVKAGTRSWPGEAEKFLKCAIINCRFFTLIGIAGTLVGSILCFVEGCSLILDAYLEYFHALWEKLDQGEVMSFLIEALDMFLVGSAMLNFGMGLYIMFVGPRSTRPNKYFVGRLLPRVAVSLHDKVLPPSTQMQCISEAKAKLGHAVLTLLQSGVVDKLKGVSLTSSLDLACFAGVILISSAGIFLLSRLHTRRGSQLRRAKRRRPSLGPQLPCMHQSRSTVRSSVPELRQPCPSTFTKIIHILHGNITL